MTDETLEALRRLLYVPDLEGIRIARLRPGDVILVDVDGNVSQQQSDEIHGQLQKVWPGHEVLICDEGLRLRVVREGPDEGTALGDDIDPDIEV